MTPEEIALLRATLADAQLSLNDAQQSLDRVSELLDEHDTTAPEPGPAFNAPDEDEPF